MKKKDFNLFEVLREARDYQEAQREPSEGPPEREILPTVWIQYYKKDSFNHYENEYPAFILQRIYYRFRRWDFGFANSLDSARFIVFCIPVETLVNMLSKGAKNIIHNTLTNMSDDNIHKVCILAFTNSDDETGTYYIPTILSELQVPIHVVVYFESLDETIIKTHGGKITPQNILKRSF